MDTNLWKIERKKYKYAKEMFLILIFAGISIGIISINLFSESFRATMNYDELSWFKLTDSYFFIKMLLSPILLASIVGRSVELENENNMWKVIKSSGVNLKNIYYTKFFYCIRKIFLYQILEWFMVLVFIIYFGPVTDFPVIRIALSFISQFSISFLLASVHYFISLKWESQLISVSAALIGTLAGIIFLFLPNIFSLVNPYSWYGRLMAIGYDYSTSSSPNIYLHQFEFKLLFLPVVLGVIILFLGSKMKEDA